MTKVTFDYIFLNIFFLLFYESIIFYRELKNKLLRNLIFLSFIIWSKKAIYL